MMSIQLALRNILGAGIRTWLNVIILSLAFVTIIGLQGLYLGMDAQVSKARITMEFGAGQYWHEAYDPFDPLTLEDSHGEIPYKLYRAVDRGEAAAVLIVPATIFPEGRIQSIQLRGVNPNQQATELPTSYLNQQDQSSFSGIPAIVGGRMASSADLEKGDCLTVRWRDANGTFDAAEICIVHVFETQVQTVDSGMLWIPLGTLQALVDMPDQSTFFALSTPPEDTETIAGWIFRDHDYLLQDMKNMVKQKTIGASIFYVLMLFMALIAIFDTQVLAIFRRRKEMGTLISLGMTRGMIIRIFTLEGALHGLLAIVLGAIYGIPLLSRFARLGWKMPDAYNDVGLSLGSTLFPEYGIKLVLGTTLLVLVSVTFVSFIPTRKIAKLKPTDALRGKIG